jgi:hypothetical protein
MHRPHVAPLALAAVLAAALVACTDDSQPTPTQPPTSAAVTVAKPAGATCDATLEKQIYSQINALFTSSVQTQARTLFGNVVTACPSGVAAATPAMLAYVQFTIDHYYLGDVLAPAPKDYATREDAVVDDWEFVFRYVYNNTPGLTVPDFSPTVLRANGGAKVIDATSADDYLVNGSWTAGILVPDQSATGVTGPHLYTITPADEHCLVTNLQQPTAVCFLFNADPKPTTSFSPQATVAECEAAAVPANHTLAHYTGGQTRLTYKVANPFDGIPTGEPHLCEGHTYTSPYAYSDGLGPAAWFALGRAASTALDFLSPRPAYASHSTGIGGSTPGISPFSPIMTYIFQATFSTPPNTVGLPPSSTADVGFFDVITATPPGSILVQSSLGDATQGLLQQPVVLSQGGGNCGTSCGGLILRGRDTTYDAGVSASYGSYLVSWQSLEDKPTLKAAPFVLRGSDGLEIARVAYETRNNQPVLTYNGTVLTTVTWAQHIAQLFEIVVDLDHQTTTLRIGPRDGPTVSVGSKSFVSTNGKKATDLKYVGAEFTGIDAGIIGWDNILFTRLPDAAAP